MNSLAARLLAAAGIVLLVFVAMTGLALERAVRERALQAQRDRLQGLAYALLGNAEISADGAFRLPTRALPDGDLGRRGSGLFAVVTNADGDIVWRSPSVMKPIILPGEPAVGEWRFYAPADYGGHLLQLAFGLRWVTETGADYRYSLTVAESAAPFNKQLARFRGVLWLWLSVAAILLLTVQLAVLRWGLAPLRRVSQRLRDIEAGRSGQIEGRYPAELRPLVESLNTMISNEKARLGRYRHALADLAHSLKTPVAVLRGFSAAPELPADQQRQLDSQLTRINEIVDYQLQRAATAGGRALAAPVSVAPIAARLIGALRKVYADSAIEFENAVADGLTAAVDDGDLTEVLGNLLDNAAKYGRQRVRVAGARDDSACVITIDDDGPGFPSGADQHLLERGVRADTRREGQGIGLAVTAEILHAYNGHIALESSPSGGGRVRLRLP